jgi:cbb3-type cytochrome oxidase subunit 3
LKSFELVETLIGDTSMLFIDAFIAIYMILLFLCGLAAYFKD